MPGHVKLGASGEPDPDPLPYLVVSMEMKRQDMAKPYDAKKSIWVPDGSGGYVEALLDSESGGKVTAMVGHEVSYFFHYSNQLWHISYELGFAFRKKLSNLSKWGLSIHPSLKSAMIWPT